jgi:hypothetical protein
MNTWNERFRLANIFASVGAGVGVLLFGTTTGRIVIFSAVGFLIGGGLGYILGLRPRSDAQTNKLRQTSQINAVLSITIGWSLVGLGVVALLVNGWNIKMVLITVAFLIAALLVTFHKRTREGPNLERFGKSDR